MRIPTLVTRCQKVEEAEGYARMVFNRVINIRNGESLTIYYYWRLAIRWSSLLTIVKRLVEKISG